MSEIRDTIADVIADRATTFGDVAVNVRTNRQFVVEISDQGYLALAGVASKDLREKIKFWTTDQVAAAEILATDVLLVIGQKWEVLPDSRVDNPASPQISFAAKKIIDGKDLG